MILAGTVIQDIRYGARMLYRNKGFTTVAVLALALGIGVNTAVFTAYKAMVARVLDARDPGRMVNVALKRDSGAAAANFSYPDYESFRDSVHSLRSLIAYTVERPRFSAIGGFVSQRIAGGSGAGRLGLRNSSVTANAEFATAYAVSENYFQALGVAPIRGRSFESMSLAELAASPSVLIAENYWQRRFAADPSILGKTIYLNGVAMTIVGIAPHDFVGTGIAAPDFWLPMHLEPMIHADDNWLTEREHLFCRIFGRLAPGATIAQARAEMNLQGDRLRALHDPRSESAKPATIMVWPGSPFPLPISQYPGLTLSIAFIMVAAAMVLAIACANAGGLQLARARSRQNEMQTRLSLGASRWRIVRQLLTESVLLASLAGVLALLVTWALLRVAANFASEALPADIGTLVFNVRPDPAILAYVCGISLLAALLFGLAPALDSSRSAIISAARGSTSSARSRRLQDILVAAQVALCLVLMISGSMLIRSSINSLTMETGYESKRVIDLELQFPESRKYTASRKSEVIRELRTRLAAVPGVTSIAAAKPPGNIFALTAAVALDAAESLAHNMHLIRYTWIEPNYFQTVGIPLVLGSGFSALAGREPSIIVSESVAQQLAPGQNPIGKIVRLGPTDEKLRSTRELTADGPSYQIIGIARDTRGFDLNGTDARIIYLPLPAERLAAHPTLIRTQSGAALVTRALDAVIASVDPEVAATASTLDDQLRQSASFIASTIAAAVATAVGLLGLFLALMGIYGTMSYIVALRTREIGIRMAIGAQKRHILALILGESTRPVVGGLLAGMLLAVGASRLLHGLLFGLDTIDALSFAGVSILFLTIALVAAYPPSRRAIHVDPSDALRYE